jgi:uncharacterized repeat protein (TIGR01451 family)/LPXTG-motif cell wall-anchored protein
MWATACRTGMHRVDLRTRTALVLLVTLLGLALAALTPAPAEAAEFSSTINFDSGFSAGDTVSTLAPGQGMTGSNLGTVSVVGYNPDVSGNTAMIFDSTCGGQTVPPGSPSFNRNLCSGQDWDLYAPSQGNTLINTEDGDAGDPDDTGNTANTFTFDFSNWGPGVVTVVDLNVVDIDDFQTAAHVALYDASNALLGDLPIAADGDNILEHVDVGVAGVARMVVQLDGSGSVDDIRITTQLPIIDLELTKTAAPSQVQVGEQTTFTVDVVNQGPDDATGVVVTDTLPAGVSYVSDNGGGAFDSATGDWTIGDLAVGASASLSIVVTVDEAGSFTNVAEVTAANEDDSDSVPGDGQGDDWDDATVTATPVIDLELFKDAVPAQVQVGEQTTFTVTVVNQGPSAATGVVVTDTLPAGVSYVSDNGGGAFDSATGDWTVGNLAVGGSAALSLVVTVDDVGTFTNVAEVTAANEDDIDSVPGDGQGDDWDDAVVSSQPIIDLELVKDADPAEVSVGDETTFTITVLNKGPYDASGVAVTDVLPDGVTYVSHSGTASLTLSQSGAAGLVTLAAPDGAYDPATGIWMIGNLPVGASTTLAIVVTVDEAGTITNVAEVTAANEVDVDSVPGDGQGDDWDDAIVEASQVLASGTIGDTVWFDEDKDGIQDSNEEGVSGVTIRLTNQGTGDVSTQVTNANGRYLFAALDPGTYVVSIVMSTAPESTALTTAGSFTVDLGPDESFLAADFGLAGSLPRTGMEIGTVALLGLAMLAAGGALLLATRKRRPSLG